MPSLENASPTPIEVERQLGRILSSEPLQTVQQQGRLLQFIVERTLQGDEITEKLIREHVFPTPPYKLDSNIARRTMDLLKGTLREYYESEGKADPVVIGFPKPREGKRVHLQAGQAYTPQFSYNPLHPKVLEIRLANHSLKQMNFFHALDSMVRFENLQTFPGLEAVALLGSAETMLRYSISDGWFGISSETYLLNGRDLALRSIEKNPSNWRAHAVLGLIELCLHYYLDADDEFNIALKLDKHETETFFGYFVYLMVDGQYQKALELAKVKSVERIDDANSQAIAALIYYVLRQNEEAELSAKSALLLDLQCWLADMVMGALLVDRGEGEAAVEYFHRSNRGLGGWHLQGFEGLCVARFPEDTPTDKALEYWRSTRLFIRGRDVFQQALSAIASVEFFAKWFPNKSNRLSLELGAKLLISSYLQYYPLTLWLNLWPFLDPVRNPTDFNEKIDQYDFRPPPSKR